MANEQKLVPIDDVIAAWVPPMKKASGGGRIAIVVLGSIVILIMGFLIARRLPSTLSETPEPVRLEAPRVAETRTATPIAAVYQPVDQQVQEIVTVDIGSNWYNPNSLNKHMDVHGYPSVGGIRWEMLVHFRNGVTTNVPMEAIDSPTYHNVEFKKPVEWIMYRPVLEQGLDHCPFRFIMDPPSRQTL